MIKLYRVDFYELVVKFNGDSEWKILHSILVETESEAKFLKKAFNGNLTMAKYEEVEI